MTLEPLELRLARRQFLYQSLSGIGGLALLHMLSQESWAVGLAARSPLAPKAPHHTPTAKACIFLSMLGGVSQADTFDPKPALRKFDNTVMDWTKERATDQPTSSQSG